MIQTVELRALRHTFTQTVAHLTYVDPAEPEMWLPGVPHDYLCGRPAKYPHDVGFRWTPRDEYPVCQRCRRVATRDDVEQRIAAASLAITQAGFELVFVDYCEDAETPGILGAYAGVTIRAEDDSPVKVKIATNRHRSREDIADALEHELHHVQDPLWDCGSGGGVLGQESGAARRRRELENP
jgi:hypothetical protein